MTESADAPATADAAYWAEIFRSHRRAMRAAAILLLGRHRSHLGHTSESVVQDVMARLIRKGQAIAAANIEAYLVAAVKNRATDVLRQEARRQRDRPVGEEEAEDAWEEPSAEDVAEAATDAVIRDETRAVLQDLDDEPRKAFVERVAKGRAFTEIGRDMGVSDVQAGRLFRQAVSEIQERLGINPGLTD